MLETPYILALPPHLLSDPFIIGQQEEDFRQIPQEKSFSETVSHVCGYVRSVALESSRLWSTIHITESSSLCRVKAYCERSRSAPLSILVRLGEAWTGDIVAVASAFEIFHLIADHAPRWHIPSLVLARDPSPPISVVDFFSRQDTPKLRSLALSAATVSGSLMSHHSMGPGYALFFSNAPHLSLVRFRGFALHLMSSPLTRIDVLHLDYPPGSSITYEALRGLLTDLDRLRHLSIDGNIVQNYPQSMSPTTVINLPLLLSLRLACKDGKLYLGILLNIESPLLQRLILKVRNGDLERRGTTVSFPQVTELVFVDFDLSAESYRRLLTMFPSVETFRAPWSTVESLFLKVFKRKVEYGGRSRPPWPSLRVLHVGFDASESALPLRRLFKLRHRFGCPLSRVIFNTKEESEVQAYLARPRSLEATSHETFSIEDGLGHWLADVEGHALGYGNLFN